MSDELLGFVAFALLFVVGLLIYDLVERWQKRRGSNDRQRPPHEQG